MQAVFGGSAWQFDSRSGQYYLHTFLPEQPDLNWEHPEVIAAMCDVLRFWMRRGVDGFRLDAVPKLVKHFGKHTDAQSRAAPTDASQSLAGTGRVPAAVAGPLAVIRRVVDEFPDRVIIAEAYAPAQQLALLYGDENRPGVHLAFDFQFIRVTSRSPLSPWTAPRIAEILRDTREGLPAGALVSYAFSNHDVPRFRSRHDGDGRGALRARAAALLQLGVRGVPCLYYGDELGMADVPIPAAARVDRAGRDPSRTPLPWDSTAARGFTTGSPWLPTGSQDGDVQSQQDDAGSLLSLYRHALWIRKSEPALNGGGEDVVYVDDDLLAVRRSAKRARPALVTLNTADHPRTLPLPMEFTRVLLATDSAVAIEWQGETSALRLPPLAAAWLVP
jgi:alpha-glucosidase